MLIPDNITDFSSTGERILYMKFKNDGSTSTMFILHSLFTGHHIKNMSGELDFLVLSPNEGFFCIEVKHGGISRRNGDWCFTDRYGQTNCKKTGPFVQQNATMNSIREYVLKRINHKKEMHDRFKRFLWGSGVAFTSMTEFVDFGPEGHSWQVLSKQGLSLPIGAYIATLSQGAHRESSGKAWYDIHKSRPTKKDCEDLVKILRGDFDINYSEINRINESESLIEEYTKEQFSLLDFVNYNQRSLIEGLAGTGKTLMALEIARRKNEENIKVGLFCFNSQLGSKLSDSIKNINSSTRAIKFSGTLHSYMVKNTKCTHPQDSDKLQKYYLEDLPIEFLISNENLDEEDKMDFLILDEAQDLLSPYFIEVFDLILKGGIKNGNWVMFGDFSNQAIYLNEPERVFEKLNKTTSFTRFPPLKINCRNTKSIARQNTLLTGVQLPEFTSRNDNGNNVTCRYSTQTSQPEVIETILLGIEKRGIPLSKVTLLSPKRIEKTIIWQYEPISTLIKKGVQTSTIQGFKGLENTIIVLYDFEDVKSDQMQRLLYVGISRARQELYIVLDRKLESSISELVGQNFQKTIKT